MTEAKRLELRNTVLGILVDETEEWSDDNLAIAMATYYEDLPNTPSLIYEEAAPFSNWAIDMTNKLADRIVERILKELEDGTGN